MTHFERIVIFATLTMLQTDLAKALSCYKCTGALGLDVSCEIDVHDYPPTECYGSKACGYHIIGKPGTEILHRDCVPQNYCQNLKLHYQNYPAVDVLECKICRTDLCNSAKLVQSSVIVLFVMFLRHVFL